MEGHKITLEEQGRAGCTESKNVKMVAVTELVLVTRKPLRRRTLHLKHSLCRKYATKMPTTVGRLRREGQTHKLAASQAMVWVKE